MKACLHCGRGDDGRPMCYRGEPYCSGRCRKILRDNTRSLRDRMPWLDPLKLNGPHVDKVLGA